MTGSQIEALRDALCSAFTQDTLDQMLRLRLDKDRAHLADSGPLPTVVFNVVETAVREGWQAKLIREAISFVPGSPALQRFRDDYPNLLADDGKLAADTSQTDGASQHGTNTSDGTLSPENDSKRVVKRPPGRGLTTIQVVSGVLSFYLWLVIVMQAIFIAPRMKKLYSEYGLKLPDLTQSVMYGTVFVITTATLLLCIGLGRRSTWPWLFALCLLLAITAVVGWSLYSPYLGLHEGLSK